MINFEPRKLSMTMSIYLWAALALAIAGDSVPAAELSSPRTPPVIQPELENSKTAEPSLPTAYLWEEAMCPSAPNEAELAEQDELLAEPAVGLVVLASLLGSVW